MPKRKKNGESKGSAVPEEVTTGRPSWSAARCRPASRLRRPSPEDSAPTLGPRRCAVEVAAEMPAAATEADFGSGACRRARRRGRGGVPPFALGATLYPLDAESQSPEDGMPATRPKTSRR